MPYSACDNRHSDQKCVNPVMSSHHMDTVHSRSSSKDSVDSVIENKNYRKDRNSSVHSENRNGSNSETNKLTSNGCHRSNLNDSENKLTLSKSSQNLNERTFVSGSENINIYATLPRKPKKLNNRTQDSEVCKTDSYHHGRTSSSGSTTPTPMDNRDTDFSQMDRNDSGQFQYDVSAQQPVKMNKAEIRQLLHTNMVQKQGNFRGPEPNKNWTSSANGNNQHYIEVCKSAPPQLTAKAFPVPPARSGRADPPPVPVKGDIVKKAARTSDLGNTRSAIQNISTFVKQGGITRHASFHSGTQQAPVGCFQHQEKTTLDRHSSLPDCQHHLVYSSNNPGTNHLTS